jgi:uncharacterized membrane protein YeiH
MALMIGAMIIHGIQPGPQIMTAKPELFWGMIASMWVGNFLLVVLNLPLIGMWVKLLTVKYDYLFPAILIFCCIGVYSINNSVFDVFMTAAFGVLGCHVALTFTASFVVAVFMGVVTATGGGVNRDVLTQTRPMIMCGEVYATAALVGSLGYAVLFQLALPQGVAQLLAFLAAFSLRAAAIIFNIRLGPRADLAGRGEEIRQR